MNSSHLVSNVLPNHHNHHHHGNAMPSNIHQQQQQQQQQYNSNSSTYPNKMPTTITSSSSSLSSSNHNNGCGGSESKHLAPTCSSSMGKTNAQTSNTATVGTTHMGAGPINTTIHSSSSPMPSSSSSSSSTSTSCSPSIPQPSQATQHKFAPARRLAARQTLRLAIPKQQGDLSFSSLANNNNGCVVGGVRHSSPSQLPPAPILKRTPVVSSATPHSLIPKTASPLESHNLPNVQLNNGHCVTATPSSGGSSTQFLRVRNPSITLNSTDLCNNNDFLAFAKELSSPAMGARTSNGNTRVAAIKVSAAGRNASHSALRVVSARTSNGNTRVAAIKVSAAGRNASHSALRVVSEHSPIFAEIASSISPSTTSSASPSNHLNRLFSLSPSSLRNYGNFSFHQLACLPKKVDHSIIMGNRVSTLWCRKSNLAIKTNNESEHSSDHNQSKTKTNAFTSHKKRESKRRFRQRRLSLNCMTREADTPPNNEEPVQIHRNSNTLPRRLKLNTVDSSKESLASSPNDTKVGENSEIQLPEVSNTNSSVFLPEIPIIAISDENSCENSVDVVDGPLPIPSALFGNLKKTVNDHTKF
ncbi:uncharacterized protein DDB_G0271670 [Stomoxys calcitrans]|uniref:uncharacterized protein DDB_G0271670 n=1 Tax=Stomoxys calcitrans TaxID=35570 RepID=UPI0027E256B4|nr:uncharacterized protein DDB_G0271670 [Stomoxys calcitrans]